jgi:hypothetical protein
MTRHASFSAAAAASVDSPWFTTTGLATYLAFPTVKACRRWLERNEGLPRHRRGASRVLLFRQSDVDAYVAGGPSRARAASQRARTRRGAYGPV